MQTLIEVESPKIKVKEKIIFSPTVKSNPSVTTDHKIMRIEMEEDYTRIDFVYNNGKYGWVQIQPESFIRPCGTETAYGLVKAQGIPLAPQKKYFSNPNQTLYYTLYFPALPKGVKEIDIIEKESRVPGHNYFNFYGVSLEKIKKEILIVE